MDLTESHLPCKFRGFDHSLCVGETTSMRNRDYSIAFDEKTYRVTGDYIDRMKSLLVPRELGSRMSDLIWVDMLGLLEWKGIAPQEILHPIKAVEIGRPLPHLKSAAPFRREPLRGFWHLHYTTAAFMAHNMFQATGWQEEAIVHQTQHALEAETNREGKIRVLEELAYRMTTGAYEDRAGAGKLTGEWVIYLPRNGANYYLSCDVHDRPDQVKFDRIMELCVRDFPNLASWVEEAKASLS